MNTTGRMIQSPLHLRVFLSSPGDVTDERALAKEAIERIQSERAYRDRLRLEIVAWDKPGAGTAMPAHLEPQEALERGLRNPSACEIVIVIFGYRMGTPLSEKHRKPNGERYWSGTEYEFLDALNAAKQQGIPEVLIYRKQGAPDVNLDDPQFEEKKAQWQRVKDFFAAFKNPDGSFGSYYKTYEKPSQFKEMLDEDLRDIVARYLEKLSPLANVPLPIEEPVEEPVWHDPPYPGLRAFRTDEAPIFFGRDRKMDELVEKLSDPRNRLIVVVGASGSGKSSLVAAGLLPRLQKNAIPGSEDWILDVRFTPGEVGDNPFMALALAFKETLQSQNKPPRDWAEKLEKNLSALIELRDLALACKPDWAELLLFIDQFEELFTLVAPRYVGPYAAWLGQAAQTERIRVVATLRADFYHRCVEWPVLAELLRTGSYPLAAPGPGALHEMITRPAERVGLTFENGLAERLLDDTGTEPGALALLAFALAELYNARTAEGRLTWAAYQGFNGVQGAIAKRAEDTFHQLGAAEGVLGEVFQQLVEVDEQGAVTRQRALREHVTQSASAEKLVNAFITARLLVVGEDNQPVVEVAHEALLKSWPRLADWIKDAQEDLRLLRQMKLAAVEWEQHGYDADYAWSLKRLLPVVKMLKNLQPSLNKAECLFMHPVNRRQLLGELDDPATTPERRETLGGWLAEMGDTRPGVGLRQDGLPDLLWVRIPGTAAVQESGQVPNFTGLRLGSGTKPDLGAGNHEKPLDIADFLLAAYPVTVAQLKPFVEQGGYQENRYWTKTRWRERKEEQWKAPRYWDESTWTPANHPVIGVSWYEVEAYCNWLNEQLHLPKGTIRLPTEAEWEWAARGPAGREYPWGDQWETWRCNSEESGIGRTSAVGCFPGGTADWWLALLPNSQVVHDLAGNVWEWTASEYHGNYSTAHQSVLNTDLPVNHVCVLRGGSWNNGPEWLRGAARRGRLSHVRSNYLGFRLARTFP